MNYMGSKQKFAKEFVPILQAAVDKSDRSIYMEPFVGGANVMDKITAKIRVGSDINPYLIELFRNLDKVAELPNNVMREEYDKVRLSYRHGTDEFPAWYVAAIGFLASYNGRFFEGGFGAYAKTRTGVRNYFLEHKNNLLAQKAALDGALFVHGDYRELLIPKGCVVYCDPPYRNTKSYDTDFDSDLFWEWAEKIHRNGADVYVSEETAPPQWKCLWSKPTIRTLDNRKRTQIVERLFHL